MKRSLNFTSPFFKKNREKFVSNLKPNSIAVFHSGDVFSRSADATHHFFQNPDIFYLSGIDQEESILILYPDAPNPEWREILLIKETSEQIKIWEGQKYTKEEASNISGIENIHWNKNYLSFIAPLMHRAESIYINLNEHDRAHFDGDYMDLRYFRMLKRDFPAHHYERSAPILGAMRMSKTEEEIATLKKAADITNKTFVKLLKEFKRFKFEFEIQAFLNYEFNMNRATFSFYPIMASGENSCCLHYNDNDKPLVSGDILLMDYGCSYSNYASDMTRTIPINGKYSLRQKQIYNATLDVFKETKTMMNTSATLIQINDESKKIMESKLIEIGLLDIADVKKQDKNNPLYKKYFPHGVSHFLGLDVHDVGNHYDKIAENAVLTCEPGIYIWDERLGIRIENDIVVSSKGNIDLLETCPIEAEEIEELMN